MTEREECVTWVQSVLRDAEIAVHNGDAGPRRAIWSQTEPVTVLGAWKNASGQQELDQLFDHLAARFSDCTFYEFERHGSSQPEWVRARQGPVRQSQAAVAHDVLVSLAERSVSTAPR